MDDTMLGVVAQRSAVAEDRGDNEEMSPPFLLPPVACVVVTVLKSTPGGAGMPPVLFGDEGGDMMGRVGMGGVDD